MLYDENAPFPTIRSARTRNRGYYPHYLSQHKIYIRAYRVLLFFISVAGQANLPMSQLRYATDTFIYVSLHYRWLHFLI